MMRKCLPAIKNTTRQSFLFLVIICYLSSLIPTHAHNPAESSIKLTHNLLHGNQADSLQFEELLSYDLGEYNSMDYWNEGIATADFNQDGLMDIILLNNVTEQIRFTPITYTSNYVRRPSPLRGCAAEQNLQKS